MAWEYPKHSCGHDGERVQMYGPGRDRQRRLEWLNAQPCPDCRKTTSHAEAERLALTLRDADRLPTLTGSVKQVEWATDLRIKALAALDAAIATIDAHGNSEQQEQARMARQLAAQQTSAHYWIDGRDQGAIDRIRRIVMGTGARLGNLLPPTI